jgi:hypothetical protein
VPGEIRTLTVRDLNPPPPAGWATGTYPWRASNPHFSRFKRGPLPVGLHGREWCAERDSNSHILRSERSDSCRLVYRRKNSSE